MQILFIDESGTPPAAPKGGQHYFVLGGVIIPEGVWHHVASTLGDIRKRFDIKGEIKWRFFAPGNKDSVNSLAHLNTADRNKVRSKIFNILTARKSIKIIAVVTSVEAAYDLPAVNTADELYQFSYKPMTERFQYFLQDMERDTGQSVNGIIVCDHRGPKDDKRLQALHQRLLHKDGVYSSSYKNLIEGLFIAPSHWSVGIQLADLVAGAIYRKFERDDDRFFDQIKDTFRTGPGGVLDGYGLVRVPKAGWI